MKNSARGFTLIETLIALVITVGAGLLLSNSWSGNFLRVRKAAIYNNITLLLERKVVELEAKHQGKKLTEISDEEGTFGETYPQYRWAFKTQPFEMPDPAALLPQSNEGQDAMLLTVLGKMREIVGKAILEGKVTVFVRSGEKEISYSLTTYFIDYESDVDIGL
jgi:general secretion pathway protein I